MSYMLPARSRTNTGFSLWKTITVGKKFRNIYMTHRKYMAPTIEWNSSVLKDLHFWISSSCVSSLYWLQSSHLLSCQKVGIKNATTIAVCTSLALVIRGSRLAKIHERFNN